MICWRDAGTLSGICLALALFGVAAPALAQPDDGDGPHHSGFSRGGLFVSPMGEPFRGPDGMAAWFKGADKNGDTRLSPSECAADADRFFLTLDLNKDGEIDPDELTHYETDILPEVQSGMGGGFGGEDRPRGRSGGGGGHHGGGGGGGHGGGRRGGGMDEGGSGGGEGSGSPAPSRPQGAARFGLLALPEPVIAADTDFNRGVSRMEFRTAAIQRCHLLDRDSDGLVAWTELPARPGRGR